MNSNFEHCLCHMYTTQFCQTSKVKFTHTSTTARSHSCYGKITRTPCVHLVNIGSIKKYPMNIIKISTITQHYFCNMLLYVAIAVWTLNSDVWLGYLCRLNLALASPFNLIVQSFDRRSKPISLVPGKVKITLLIWHRS